MKKYIQSHISKVVALSFFLVLFGLGGLYTNCGTIEQDAAFIDLGDGYRQKVFVDEVHDVFPAKLCQDNCVEENPDGSYALPETKLKD